jgi:hypothetical protein
MGIFIITNKIKSLPQPAKTLCLSYYCYVYSSTKLEKRAEQVLLGSEGDGGRGTGDGAGHGRGKRRLKQCIYI